MFSLLQKKTTTLLSSLAVSFGALLVPVNMAQAAVFRLTIDGLEGSGEIGFNDESLIGVYEEDILGIGPVKLVQGSELINGYFNWSFTAEGESYIQYLFGEYIRETYLETFELNNTRFRFDFEFSGSDWFFSKSHETAFRDAVFMFQNEELIHIDDYSVIDEWISYSITSDQFSLNKNSASFYSYYDLYNGDVIEVGYVNKSNLTPNYSTIVPWQNPNISTEVPEPNAVFALVGIGLLLNKKNKFHRQNSQKSENINSN